MFKLEPRREPSQAFAYGAPLLAVLLTMVAALLVFAAMGINGPLNAVYQMFLAPLTHPEYWPDLLVKAAPLILIGVGLSIGFRANVWNIGGEGQYIMGAIAATAVALAFWSQEGFWILPLMGLAGIAGGMAYAAVVAFLRARFGVSEILTSLMLNYVAIQFLFYLVNSPWKNPEGAGMPETRMFNDWESLPHISEGSVVHIGVPIALIVAIVLWVVMERTIIGFAIRVVGTAPAAARHGGFSESRTIWFALLAGGGFAGLAGMLEASGPFGQLTPQFPANYGYTAIIVAFLGRLHPLGIIAAGLVLAVTYVGGELAQSSAGVPQASAGMFQATMLFFLLALDVLVRYRIVAVKKQGAVS